MIEKSYASTTLGLDLSSSGLKGALLTLQNGKPKIVKLYQLDLDYSQKDHEQHLNPLYMTEEGQAFLELTKKHLLISSLNAAEILVRQLEIKLKKEKDIDAVLAFQAEPLLPYPSENAVLDRIIADKSPDGTRLTLLAVRVDHLKQHLEKWAFLEIEPEVVGCLPSALAAFATLLIPAQNSFFVLHMGVEQTCCIFVKQGKLIAAQSSTIDLRTIKQAIGKAKNLTDPKEIEEAFETFDWNHLSEKGKATAGNETILAAVESLHMELSRIVFALMKQAKELDLPQILATGEGAINKDLSFLLLQKLSKQLLHPEPLPSIDYPLSELQLYAIAIGSAITALSAEQNQINFRQGKFTYPHPWRRQKQPLALFGAASLLLTVAAIIFSSAYVASEEDEVRREYAQLLTSLNKPYVDFEAEIAQKNGIKKGEEPEPEPLKSLALPEIHTRLQILEKELLAIPDVFPLLPNVPKVSDVLAWLSTHPQVLGKKENRKESDEEDGFDSPTSPIQIQSFQYTMVKRPETTKKNEKYQVKVDIEFSSSNPTSAREFHDALLAPNHFVDEKGGVKWSTNKNMWRAIFFLKDKTVYP